jgi:ribosomal protein L30E
MNIKTANFININCLINNEAHVWIIDKDNPNTPVLKIDKTDFDLFMKGLFIVHNLVITYNGKDVFINPDLYEKLKNVSKLKKIPITNFRFSLHELLNVNNENFTISISSIKHLINSDNTNYLILDRQYNKDTKIVKDTIAKLKENGIAISNIYTLNDGFITNYDNDKYIYHIQKILIQHFFGFKLSNGKLDNEHIEQFNVINLFDSKFYITDIRNGINRTIRDFIQRNENIKPIITDVIKEDKPILYTHKTNNNQLNKLETDSVRLEYISFFKTFEQFNYYNK